MNPVILKYCGVVSSRVEKFQIKATRPYKANLRCPVCGDSRKNKNKARGWLLEKPGEDSVIYYCHNCGFSSSFANFLRRLDISLFEEFTSEYGLDKFKYSSRRKTDVEIFADKMKPPKFHNDPVSKWFKGLSKISQLPVSHPAKKYVESRCIPSKEHYRIYYCENFKEFSNRIIPGKFKNTDKDEPRIILPFLNKESMLIGYTARAIVPVEDRFRYMTIMIDSDSPKVFGLDVCDQSKPHMLVEGPIDSLFIDNCIAIAGGGSTYEFCNENTIMCYDNEPRKIDTVKRMGQALDAGLKLVIWPDSIKEKDINDFVINHPKVDISSLLYHNVYEGLQARLKLNDWSKV